MQLYHTLQYHYYRDITTENRPIYIASQGEILYLVHYLLGSISCGMFLSGPKEQTVGKFWQMVWEQQLPTIVMLTRCVEDGRVSTLNA